MAWVSVLTYRALVSMGGYRKEGSRGRRYFLLQEFGRDDRDTRVNVHERFDRGFGRNNFIDGVGTTIIG